MKKAIYKYSQSQENTDLVRSYFAEKDELKKDILYQKIITYTQLSFYQVPYRLKLLPEEALCEFFLSVVSQIDNILESYKLSKMNYDSFLVAAIKYKARYFIQNKRTKDEKENTILKYNIIINETPSYEYRVESTSPISQVSNDRLIYEGKLNKNDLKDIFDDIINQENQLEISNQHEAMYLCKYLENKAHRKYLLMQILFTHNELSSDEIDYFALIFNVSPYLFDELDYCLKLWCKARIEKIEDQKRKATKHWKRLMLYEKTLQGVLDEETYKEILLLRKRCIHMINENSKEIFFTTRGLTVRNLADIFNTKPNSISVFFSKQKKELALYLSQLKQKESSVIIEANSNYNEVDFENIFCKWQ